MSEQYLAIDHPTVDRFIRLPIDTVTQLPMEDVTPSGGDEMKQSHTRGPIDVYALQVVDETDEHYEDVVLWIADGNRRFHTQKRARSEIIVARRVIPKQENDIRYMFQNFAKWALLGVLLDSPEH